MLQVEIIAAAPRAIDFARGQEIKVVHANVPRPGNRRIILSVPELTKDTPCLGRITLVQQQKRFHDLRFAGLEPDPPTHSPGARRRPLQGLEETRLHRIPEQRDTTGRPIS
jgi:hypothetical protein